MGMDRSTSVMYVSLLAGACSFTTWPSLGRAAVWYGTTGLYSTDGHRPNPKITPRQVVLTATHRTLMQNLREMTTVVAEADQEEVELILSLSLGRASRASHVLKDKTDLFGHGSKSVGGDDHPSLERKKFAGTGKNHGELERFLSCPPQSNCRVSHQTPSGYLLGEYGHPFKPWCGVPHLTTPAVLRPCKKPRHSDQDSGYGGHGKCVTDHTTNPARGTLGAYNCGSSRSCSNREHLRRQQSTSRIELLDQPTTHLDTNKSMCPSSAGGKTQPVAPSPRSILSMNQEKMTGKEIRGMGLESKMNQSLPKMPCVSATGNGPNGKTVKGFLYRYTRAEVTIVCVCHGSSFSPAEFVKHSGGTDVSNPLKHILVAPFEF